jgi:hypothetical protein
LIIFLIFQAVTCLINERRSKWRMLFQKIALSAEPAGKYARQNQLWRMTGIIKSPIPALSAGHVPACARMRPLPEGRKNNSNA